MSKIVLDNVAGGYALSTINTNFEGNANYDVVIGNVPASNPPPIGCKVINNYMESESIGVTPYGNFPYLAKVFVNDGSFAAIRDNNMQITANIPLIIVASPAVETEISGNRLQSSAPVSGRIQNNTGTLVTRDNHPEAATVAVGSFVRTMTVASGAQTIAGLGFKPTSIEFWASVDATPESSFGVSALTNVGYSNRCTTRDSAGAQFSSNDAIRVIRATAGNEQKAVLVTMDLDGFTIQWTKVGAPPANDLVVNYIARR